MKKVIIPISILLVIVVLAVFLIGNIEDHLLVNAKAVISAKVNLIMEESINSALLAGIMTGELVNYITENPVLYIQTNSLVLNQLAAAACERVQSKMDDLCSVGVAIPLGSAFGIDLFAGSGPKIKVDVFLGGTVSNDYESTFISTGINQTKHRIDLVISVKVFLFLASKSNEFIISNSVTVFEGIIVGTVPNYYVHTKDNILDLKP